MLADALAQELREIGIPAKAIMPKSIHVGTDESLEIGCGAVYRRGSIWVYFTGTSVEVQLSGEGSNFYDLIEPGSVERIITKIRDLYNYTHLNDGS